MRVRIVNKHESMLEETEQLITYAITLSHQKHPENLNELAGSIVEKLDDWLAPGTWNAILTKSGSESGFLVQFKPGTCLEAKYEGYDFVIFQSPPISRWNFTENLNTNPHKF